MLAWMPRKENEIMAKEHTVSLSDFNDFVTVRIMASATRSRLGPKKLTSMVDIMNHKVWFRVEFVNFTETITKDFDSIESAIEAYNNGVFE